MQGKIFIISFFSLSFSLFFYPENISDLFYFFFVTSATQVLLEMIHSFRSQGITLAFVKLRSSVKPYFVRSGIYDLIGSHLFFRKVRDAVDYFHPGPNHLHPNLNPNLNPPHSSSSTNSTGFHSTDYSSSSHDQQYQKSSGSNSIQVEYPRYDYNMTIATTTATTTTTVAGTGARGDHTQVQVSVPQGIPRRVVEGWLMGESSYPDTYHDRRGNADNDSFADASIRS